MRERFKKLPAAPRGEAFRLRGTGWPEWAILAAALAYWVCSVFAVVDQVQEPVNSSTSDRTFTVGEPEIRLEGTWGDRPLARVTLFPADPGVLEKAGREALSLRLESPPGVPVPLSGWHWNVDGSGAVVVDFDPPLKISKRFSLSLAGPPGSGWKFDLARDPRLVIPPGVAAVPVAKLFPPRPGDGAQWLAVAGLAAGMAVLLIAPRFGTFLPVLFLLFTGAMLRESGFLWATRVWHWWGEFWPDGYAPQAYLLADWLQGRVTYAETGITSFRNGQAWVVPFLLAAAHSLGCPMQTGYGVLSIASLTGALALGLSVLRRLGAGESARGVFLALAATSYPLLRAAASLLTDAAAVFALAVFVWLFVRFLENPRSLSLAAAVALAVAAACQVRVAMIPLLLLPPCVGAWSVVLGPGREGTLGSRASRLLRIALPGLAAAVILLGCWQTLGVLESVAAAKAFAQREVFAAHFSWGSFTEKTLWTLLPLGLVVIALAARFPSARWRLPSDSEAALLGTVCGAVLLLAAGRIIPWSRYWAPAAYPAVLLASLWTVHLPRTAGMAVALAVAAANTGLIAVWGAWF